MRISKRFRQCSQSNKQTNKTQFLFLIHRVDEIYRKRMSHLNVFHLYVCSFVRIGAHDSVCIILPQLLGNMALPLSADTLRLTFLLNKS